MAKSAPPTRHAWTFIRTGGLAQVSLDTPEDLLALGELNPKLWVALSCPVEGLELDEATLKLVDTEGDGHIHVREVVTAVAWAAAHLKKPGDLLESNPKLPLAAINDLTDEGKTVLASAKRILASLGKANADSITVEDTADTAKLLTAKAPNGDGVVTPRASDDKDVQKLIADIIATVGGVPDRAGGEGVNAEKVDAFFGEVEKYLKWVEATAEKNLPELGDRTGPACIALRAVRAKIEDYFARCRLAAFDPRATAALNRQEVEYLAIAAKDMTITAEEVAGFPLARVSAECTLPLLDGINPAWRGAMETLHKNVIVPLFGADKRTLTPADWSAISAKFAPYESWLGSGAGSVIERIGPSRAKDIVHHKSRAALAELIARDKELGPEYNAVTSVAKLTRYYRDLRTLLRNFVNFAD